MRWDRLCIILLLVCCTRAEAVRAEPASQEQRATVFIVHSYDDEYMWTKNITQGVKEALRGLNAAYEIHFLDAKRDPAPGHLQAKAQDILARIETSAPQVVIAVDDAAQAYLVVPYLKNRAGIQVIFCGVNAPINIYGYPAANVSGVRERWHFREGFALLKKIRPAMRSVAFLTDDSDASGYVLHDLGTLQKQGGRFALKLAGVEKVHTYQQWQLLVQRYQKQADSLALGTYYSLMDEATGKMVPGDVVAAWTNSVNRLPTLGFADYSLKHGHLCGILESGHEQGFLAGSMARNVLERNIAAGQLPVRINERGLVTLNLKTAERLGIHVPFEFISAASVVIK